jgi:preprotein translocase subunit SecE
MNEDLEKDQEKSQSSAPINDTDRTNKKNRPPKEGSENKLIAWIKAKRIEFWAEFKRIVWPSREDLMKQTLTVIVISLIFGAYIAVLDGAFALLFSSAVSWIGTLQ